MLDTFKEKNKVNKKKEAFMIVVNIVMNLKQNFFMFYKSLKKNKFYTKRIRG